MPISFGDMWPEIPVGVTVILGFDRLDIISIP